jgi:Tetratricopeptide repeat
VAGPRSSRARRAGPTFLRRLAAALAVTFVASVAGAAPPIPLELRFDGRPVDPKAPPDFSCFSASLGRWIRCRVEKGEARGAYLLERPEPARYRLHVSVDENPPNPRRYPGDYEAQVAFEVTDTGPERLVVDLARLIHLTRPGDNCANCMVGDTTQGIVQNLSQLYLDAERHDEAIEICRRLIAERGADVSPYKLAETWERIAWAHWQKGEHQRASEVIADALVRYGGTVRGDDLRRTRAYFERESAVTAPAIQC